LCQTHELATPFVQAMSSFLAQDDMALSLGQI
jgi:hypothetical protein